MARWYEFVNRAGDVRAYEFNTMRSVKNVVEGNATQYRKSRLSISLGVKNSLFSFRPYQESVLWVSRGDVMMRYRLRCWLDYDDLSFLKKPKLVYHISCWRSPCIRKEQLKASICRNERYKRSIWGSEDDVSAFSYVSSKGEGQRISRCEQRKQCVEDITSYVRAETFQSGPMFWISTAFLFAAALILDMAGLYCLQTARGLGGVVCGIVALIGMLVIIFSALIHWWAEYIF